MSGKESGKKREKCLLSFIGKKVQFDRTALFYCKLRKQSVKDGFWDKVIATLTIITIIFGTVKKASIKHLE